VPTATPKATNAAITPNTPHSLMPYRRRWRPSGIQSLSTTRILLGSAWKIRLENSYGYMLT
jgi:hypothetical protein